MLKLPGKLTAETFLEKVWQKCPLFMPAALGRVQPSISRNELAWLATLDDVESRLVFVDRDRSHCHYRAETGPFDPEYLKALPKRDWTLLVHDVEKHLPAMRALFQHVPFIPDWRIDDLMVSFAAPGGGVGPHKDNYDVFLCQGIGIRNWRYTGDSVAADASASDDLALLAEFSGDEDLNLSAGDVLYLPPGAAHWGTAKRACMTYSIGMRAPNASDLSILLNCCTPNDDEFYRDPDLTISEAKPGYISSASARRATQLLGLPVERSDDAAEALGRFATRCKDWLIPDNATPDESDSILDILQKQGRIHVHGMSQIAFDDHRLYVNGSSLKLPRHATALLTGVCTDRFLCHPPAEGSEQAAMLRWMLQRGAFEITEDF